MSLAIFDLDNTLLAGDSDYLWGRHLVERGLVDAAAHEAANARFYQEYREGRLDIYEFLAFALQPLHVLEPELLYAERQLFLEQRIRPILLPKAYALLDRHRHAGDTLLIITATNRFITEPIADFYAVEHLLATEPEVRAGRYTGRVAGTPCYREGKVERLRNWLEQTGHQLAGSSFYSDSHNDLPLLSLVERPVAVDPDPTLAAEATRRGWPLISLRG